MRTLRLSFYSLFIIGIAFSISGTAQSANIDCGDIRINALAAADHFSSKDSSHANSKDSIQPYIELKDGTKIFGKSLSITLNNYPKGKIKIDNNEYRIKDTHGYFDGNYYGRTRNTYAIRFITGKINIYRANFGAQVDVTNFSGKTNTYDRPFCNYYAQKGDSTDLVLIMTFNDLKQIVKDCPKSFAMIDKSVKEMRQAMKENPLYLNEIISIYNKGCE